MTGASDASESRYGIAHEFGFVPTFFFRGKTIGPAQLTAAIARSDGVEVDFDALNVFLRTDMFIGGATPFLEVRRFSPPPTIVPPVEMTREQAMEGFVDLFRQAIRRRATTESVLALSGGRDSRHILFELYTQGCLPKRAVTVELETSTDGEVAREVANAVGIPHLIELPNRTPEGVRYTVRATDLMSQQHAWIADVARGRNQLSWWDGIAGDVLSAGHFIDDSNLRLFETGALDELAERLVRTGPVPYYRDQTLFPRARALEAVRQELSLHVGAANPVGSFYFWNRTRVNIGSSAFGLLRPAGQHTFAPYLDRDLWRFLASIPVRHVADHMLHDDVIRTTYPQFAHIGYAHKKTPGLTYYRERSKHMLRYLATQRSSLLSIGAAARTLRSLVLPSRAADIDWIVSSWFFCDEIESVRRGRMADDLAS